MALRFALAAVGMISGLAACTGGEPTGTSSAGAVSTMHLAPADTDIAPGGALTLSVTLQDANGRPVTGQTVTWSTSSSAVATVSTSGVLAGVSPGIVTVTATAGTKSAHAVVGVVPPEAAVSANAPPLTLDASANRHTISPLIYGMSAFGLPSTSTAYVQSLGLTVTRWGGDGITRYNWQTDESNAGADWYFMAGGGTAPVVPGGQVDAIVRHNISLGVASFVSIPIIDYVNSIPAGQSSCSYPATTFPNQDSWNPYVHPTIDGQQTNCGSGTTGGVDIALTTAQILALHVHNSVPLQQGWIQHLVSTFGSAANGGVPIFALDNEPSGWGNTHHDVAPGQITYQNLLQRTQLYAPMIKSVDGTASVAGPEDFGWAVYVGNPSANGGLYNAEYYLQQMQQFDAAHGGRTLDYFTEHFYASPPGVVTFDGTPGTAAVQAARLRSTRSLWDSTYKEENWIGQYYPPIQLIRTFHTWVNQYYPGTKIGITEYNWGGQNSINGALAQADVLGIFGREALDLATLWGPPDPSWPAAASFSIYRNYDNAGSKFGDTSVLTASANQDSLSVYGAIRSSDGALTLVAINKSGTDITAAMTLANFVAGGPVHIYQLTPASPAVIVRAADRWSHMHGFTQRYPANSITLLVMPPRPS
jgi:hypothetical protein